MGVRAFVAGTFFGVVLGGVVPLAANYQVLMPGGYGLAQDGSIGIACVNAIDLPLAGEQPGYRLSSTTMSGTYYITLVVDCR
jgi:hypothetical protein